MVIILHFLFLLSIFTSRDANQSFDPTAYAWKYLVIQYMIIEAEQERKIARGK